MNDLIATAAPGPALSEAYKCVEITNSIGSIAEDFQANDPAMVLFDSAMLAVDVASAISDPIATLASSVANFLLTYMPPLPELLDFLVGNPSAVQAQAQTWTNIQGQIVAARGDLSSAVSDALAGWTGVAADAYRELSDLFGQMMDGVASGAGGVASALQGASAIIELIRTIIVQLVSTLVGALISYAVEAAATLGLGAPVIIGQATIKIGSTSTKAAKWSDDLISTIKKVSEFVSATNEQFKVALPFVESTTETLTIISVKDILNNSRQFVETLTAQPGTSS